jgi:hypothetical protein
MIYGFTGYTGISTPTLPATWLAQAPPQFTTTLEQRSASNPNLTLLTSLLLTSTQY